MILADVSVWIDHLAKSNAALDDLLAKERVLGHALVTAEIMLGSVASRESTASRLDELYQIRVASVDQTRSLIERRQLWSVGIGYVDANLLTSTLLAPGALLMTRDKRLYTQAERLGIAYLP